MRSLAVMAIFASVVAAQQAPAPPLRDLTFYNARIIDGDGKVVAANGFFSVHDGRVTKVANGKLDLKPGPGVVDLAGATVMPGLVNAHGHVGDTQGMQSGAQFYTESNLLAQLRRYASYGVTTVVSLGGD